MIREARPTDYKAIKQLISAGVKEGSLQPRKKKEIKKSIKNGRTVVAEVEDQIVGTASVTVYDMRLAEVRSLYVTEEARGNGLAKELINGILEKPVAQLPSATLIAITQTPEVFESVGFDTSQEKRHIVFKSI
jgi:N-acetylglutamate synthase-like GNAT family acetyltransferase